MKLKQINGKYLDLNQFPELIEFSKKPYSFTEYIINNEINNNVWWDKVLEQSDENSVIVDAGANVGLFSLYMLPKVKELYCIEPMTEHSDVLLSLGVGATIIKKALCNYDGTATFTINNNNTTCNKIGNGDVTVETTTLLSVFDEYNLQKIDLLKLDVEGAEKMVILEDETVGEALKRCKVVFIECHTPPWGDVNENDIINKMKSFGFNHKRGTRSLSHYFINKV